MKNKIIALVILFSLIFGAQVFAEGELEITLLSESAVDALGREAEDVRSFGVQFNMPSYGFTLLIYKEENEELFHSENVKGGVGSYYISPANWTKKLSPNTKYIYVVEAYKDESQTITTRKESYFITSDYVSQENEKLSLESSDNNDTEVLENLPDLAPVGFGLYDYFTNKPLQTTPVPGQYLSIKFFYINVGAVKIGKMNFKVEVYLDGELVKDFIMSHNDVPINLDDVMMLTESLNQTIEQGRHELKFIIDTGNHVSELNEDNNVHESVFFVGDEMEEEIQEEINPEEITSEKDQMILTEEQRQSKLLIDQDIDEILAAISEAKNISKEEEVKKIHIAKLIEGQEVSDDMENALTSFITYGVDRNTKGLGEGERAAVVHSYKIAYNKLPGTEDELSDLIRIANGRWPSTTNEEAEKRAMRQFEKIYKRIADMEEASDNAAITVMAYGLRQKAENRNLDSETQGIKTFKAIYGYNPNSTEDWNIMQAITYSGASRGLDSDGDLLLDEREDELGTDKNNPDSDGDGYGDGEEVVNGFNPKGQGKL